MSEQRVIKASLSLKKKQLSKKKEQTNKMLPAKEKTSENREERK